MNNIEKQVWNKYINENWLLLASPNRGFFDNLNKWYAKFSCFENEKEGMISENKNGDFHDLK